LTGSPGREEKLGRFAAHPSVPEIVYIIKNYLYDALGNNQTRRVAVESGKLWYEAAPGRNIEIVPESRTKSVVRGSSAYVTFDFNEEGGVIRLVIHQASGATIEAVKQ
jgi:hypothetical protein